MDEQMARGPGKELPIPWCLKALSGLVLELGGTCTEGIFRWVDAIVIRL